MITDTYTGGRQMMVTDIPHFIRPVTVADLTPGTREYEAREAYRRNIEDQYLWELEREERRGALSDAGRIALAFASAGVLLAAVITVIIGFAYLIGA